MYGKCPQISNTLFHNFLAKFLLLMQLFLKILSGMANRVDPDQTLICTVCIYHFVCHFSVRNFLTDHISLDVSRLLSEYLLTGFVCVREMSGNLNFFKVGEFSGNSVIYQEKVKFCKNFREMSRNFTFQPDEASCRLFAPNVFFVAPALACRCDIGVP